MADSKKQDAEQLNMQLDRMGESDPNDVELAAVYASLCLSVLMQDSDFRPRLLATMRAMLNDPHMIRSPKVRMEIEKTIKRFEQIDRTH